VNLTEPDWLPLALVELRKSWERINRDTFGRSLKPPQLESHGGKTKLGQWNGTLRVISLSESLLREESWLRVEAVLKHEMLHQFIHETMGGQDLPPHGQMFQSLRQKFGIEEYEEVGLGTQASSNLESPILSKVRKLLALAQSDQIHEAEAAVSKANALILKWNLDQTELKEKRHHEVRHLGKPGRMLLHLKMLGTLVRDFFFVETIWVMTYDAKKKKHGRVLEIIGLPENVELAAYAYDFILNVGEFQFKLHKKDKGRGHRQNFLYGLVCGFYEKCEEERASQSEKGLVWTGEPWLNELMKNRHPRTRSVASSRSKLDPDSFNAGKEQGKKLVLRKGVNGNQSEKLGRRSLLPRG
jgi:predicted SprT family Zn-dependent metalloprotease